ncbi:hypothetical protein [Colwellia piezophila]|uniref:hypothetical protein n=1 Tax=Colwellia piezophila TaxID=211668 RepID=UPI00037C9707|nr:hypothetical protein [Colwellia piezophila]
MPIRLVLYVWQLLWSVIMIELKIQAVGTGVGVELPQEVLNQLRTKKGESIFLENMFDGSYSLVKHDVKYAEKLMLIDGQMHEEDS